MKLKLPTLILTLLLILTLVPAAFADNGEVKEVSDFCLDTSTYLHPEEGFQHPVGSRIALRYEVEYTVVMSWFCDGYGFGQIMLALETSKVTSDTEQYKTPEDLLALRTYGFGWGEIWKDMEFIGRPKGDDWAGGPPPWAGSERTDDEEGEGFGPPPWAGGPPEWAGSEHTDDEEGEGFGPPPWAGGPPLWAGPKFKPPTP
jgi:hypothetical protein